MEVFLLSYNRATFGNLLRLQDTICLRERGLLDWYDLLHRPDWRGIGPAVHVDKLLRLDFENISNRNTLERRLLGLSGDRLGIGGFRALTRLLGNKFLIGFRSTNPHQRMLINYLKSN